MRYTSKGVLAEVVELPAKKVTAGAFSGPSLDQLFIITLREGFDPGADLLAGLLFRVVVRVTGQPDREFAD